MGGICESLLLLFLYEFLLDVYVASNFDDFVGERWVLGHDVLSPMPCSPVC